MAAMQEEFSKQTSQYALQLEAARAEANEAKRAYEAQLLVAEERSLVVSR